MACPMSLTTHFKNDPKISPRRRTVRSDSATAARDNGGERKGWSLGPWFQSSLDSDSTGLHHSTTPLGVPGSFCGLTWQQEFLVMPMTRDDQIDPIPVEQRQLLHWLWLQRLQIKLEVGESSAPKSPKPSNL